MDTPEHHVFTGMKQIDQEQYAAAQVSFERAVALAPRFARAYGGLALARAYSNDFNSAFDLLDKAREYARTNEETVFVHIGAIRVHTLSKAACKLIGTDCGQDSAWLDKTKDEFQNAVALAPRSAEAYYYMGLAYKNALRLPPAEQMFAKVLDLGGPLTKAADNEWKLVQEIQRAMPGTVTGRKIALVEKISRADTAALFMEELRIDILYKKRTPKAFDTSFKDLDRVKISPAETRRMATDIEGHPLKADIEGILQIGVRGLEVQPDGRFLPGEPVSRAAYALMIEDILIRLTGDTSMATRYIGGVSPFPDVRSDLPYFNAVMVATSRGLMQVRGVASGEFAPLGGVSGVEALLTLKKLKEELTL
jgi:hypothetical protein